MFAISQPKSSPSQVGVLDCEEVCCWFREGEDAEQREAIRLKRDAGKRSRKEGLWRRSSRAHPDMTSFVPINESRVWGGYTFLVSSWCWE